MKNRFFLAVFYLIIGCNLFAQDYIKSSPLEVLGITANTKMGIAGQMVTSFSINFNKSVDISKYKNLVPKDFIITKNFTDVARISTLASTIPTAIQVKDNRIIIDVDPFYFKGNSHYSLNNNDFKVICRYPSLEYLCTFEYSDITNVTTEVVDQFTAGIQDNMTYRLFTPNSNRKLPLVIWLHGGSGSGKDNKAQLISYLGASYFAEPSFQQKQKCVVLAPQQPREFGSAELPKWSKVEFDAIIKVIDELVKKGIIDKKRIYLVGGSMGGLGVYDLIKEYPDYITASLRSANGIRLANHQSAIEFVKSYPGFPDKIVPIFHSVGKNDLISKGANVKQAFEIQQVFRNNGINKNYYNNQVYVQKDFMDAGLGYTKDDLTDNYVKLYNIQNNKKLTKEKLLKEINYSYQHWSWILDIKSDKKIEWLFSHKK